MVGSRGWGDGRCWGQGGGVVESRGGVVGSRGGRGLEWRFG